MKVYVLVRPCADTYYYENDGEILGVFATPEAAFGACKQLWGEDLVFSDGAASLNRFYPNGKDPISALRSAASTA